MKNMLSLLVALVSVVCLSPTAFAWYMNNNVGGGCASPTFDHGTYDPMAYFIERHNVGTKMTFACDEGYTLEGPDFAYCRMGGTWTRLPRCIRKTKCLAPVLHFGFAWPAKENFKIGEYVGFYCRFGFRLDGARWSKCGANGNFHPNVPICKPKESVETVCVLPENIDDEVYIEPHKSNYKVDEFVTFDCMGYKKVDGHSISKCGEDGRFDPLPPRCVAPKCDAPMVPKFGMISPVRESYIVGDVVTFKCEEGFELVGDVNTTCQEEGNFTKASVLCSSKDVERTCKLPASKGGVVYINPEEEYHFGETLSYSCKTGYTLIGDGKLVCLPSTEWSDKPRCRRSRCVRPSSPINGKLKNEKKIYYTFGQRAKFLCNEGFKIVGETDVPVCGNDGFFHPSLPKCQRIPKVSVSQGSCKERCRTRISGASCQCDLHCLRFGDCCPDFTKVCYH